MNQNYPTIVLVIADDQAGSKEVTLFEGSDADLVRQRAKDFWLQSCWSELTAAPKPVKSVDLAEIDRARLAAETEEFSTGQVFSYGSVRITLCDPATTLVKIIGIRDE